MEFDALRFGTYPTAVELLAPLCTGACELWVKRDDLAHPSYGGNKVRKLERLLAVARARGASRVIAVGAAGSHQVLATAYFGRAAGLRVEGVLFPQPRTDHASEVLRAGLGLGLTAHAVASVVAVPFATARAAARPGAFVLPPGGSNVEGALGYVEAARELAAQVRAGVLPEPDVCVVALGSGGTAAGLAAGFAAEGLKTRVVGALVLRPTWVPRVAASRLARALGLRIGGRAIVLGTSRGRAARLGFDERFIGAGYGYETTDGRAALRSAANVGLALDPTYTAKAFACALWHVRARRAQRVLYWHTLSSAPMGPLLEQAPAEDALSPALRRLWLRPEPR